MPGKFEAPRGSRRPTRRPEPVKRPETTSRPEPNRRADPARRPEPTGRPDPNRRPTPARRPRRKRRSPFVVIIPVLLILGLAVALLLSRCGGEKDPQDSLPRASAPTEITDVTTPSQPDVVARATVASQGDVLMHIYLFTGDPRFPAASNLGEGKYNFDSIFQYVRPYISESDYAVINLETTLGGDDYPYSGNPLFNCPDPLADSLAGAGYDTILTANNHCADTTVAGLKRTVEQVRSRNLTALGTQLSDQEKKYEVVDVNGIRIGMFCYTYASGLESDGSPNLNLNAATIVREKGVVNYFTADHLDRLYAETQEILDDMKAEGVEATMLFIHWGTEYTLSQGGTYTMTQDATQSAIAQKMCDLGIDVIVGGHPHVVEPMDLLTSSTDPDHKTVCIYSLGNAVSNQRREEMKMKTGHTEDGALFTVTFEKNSLGAVQVSEAEVIPTWVNKFVNGDGKVEYNILPLDESTRSQWQSLYGLTDAANAELQASFERTMAIVGPGLNKCREYLGVSTTSTTGE